MPGPRTTVDEVMALIDAFAGCSYAEVYRGDAAPKRESVRAALIALAEALRTIERGRTTPLWAKEVARAALADHAGDCSDIAPTSELTSKLTSGQVGATRITSNPPPIIHGFTPRPGPKTPDA